MDNEHAVSMDSYQTYFLLDLTICLNIYKLIGMTITQILHFLLKGGREEKIYAKSCTFHAPFDP